MRELLYTTFLSLFISIVVVFGFYNLIPFQIDGLGNPDELLGSSITTIAGSDTLKNSRTTINDNFTALNNGKIEASTTSLPLLTTLSGLTTAGALSTIGTIVSGIWHGTLLAVGYGGTGSSTLQTNGVLYGQGTSALKATPQGVDGQVLGVSSGVPTWQSVTTDESLDYDWTGADTFTDLNSSSTTLSGTTNITGNTTISSSTIANLTFGTLNSGTISYGTFTATSTVQPNVSSTAQTITVGWEPEYIKIDYYLQGYTYPGIITDKMIGSVTYLASNLSIVNADARYCYNEITDGVCKTEGAGTAFSLYALPGVPDLSAGGNSVNNGDCLSSIAVTATSTTGFTITKSFNTGGGAFADTGRISGQWTAYR